MRVLLVGNYTPIGQQSMARFAKMLRKGLEEAGCEVRIVQAPVVLGWLAFGSHGLAKWLGYLDQLVLFPHRLRLAVEWADVVHICDQGNAVYLPYLGGRPHVVTCHDLIAIRSGLGETPEHRTRLTGRLLLSWILARLQRAQRVVCVSEQTRQDLLRVAGLPPARTGVVHNALNYPYRPMAQDEAVARLKTLGLKPERPFLLHVGGNQWYKNREGLLRIFRAFTALPGFGDYKLVLAGKPWTPSMRQYISQAELARQVVELISISNEDLRALYSCAKALVFPSLYEGFGWPIIEAQACGCPVFTTDRAPMTEVGGRGTRCFDPADEMGTARIIARGIADREALRARGFENMRRFSPKVMVSGYLAAYRQVLAETGAGRMKSAPAGAQRSREAE
jgi:glycosyltransferase involved in cell wall biosynthesis